MKDALHGLSDERYQREAWFGGGRFVSSPVEAYCTLFDDADFEEFIVSPFIGLSATQITAAERLRDLMREFENLVDIEAPSSHLVVIDHPNWGEVRGAAKEFLETLK